MSEQQRFFSPSRGPMTFPQVVRDIVGAMEAESDFPFQVIVGTDSHPSLGETDFVSAIILRRVGKGGRYFWKRSREGIYRELTRRIYREAALSFELAKALMEQLESHTLLDFNFEIHVDVGHVVKEGEALGTVGETGSLGGPSLYFELRRGGDPVDPEPWLLDPRG